MRKHGGVAGKARIRREALRLLSAFGEECGARIRIGAAQTFHLEARGDGEATSVDKAIVAYCLREGWLELNGNSLSLSHAGLARLRRERGGAEPFREQHQLRSIAVTETSDGRRPIVSNDGESPLGWLRRRKDRNGRPLISSEQYEAEERLRRDHWYAHLSPRVTANWSSIAPSKHRRRGPPSDAASMRDEVLAARERVGAAIEAVGPELAGVLIDICCDLKGLEEAEKGNGWPQRAGKVVLQIALTRLARHYGIGAQAPPSSRGIRHWGCADFRPTLNRWRRG